METKTIYDETLRYHITQGGTKGTSTEYRGFINKGLSILRNKGLAENPCNEYYLKLLQPYQRSPMLQ